MMIPGHALPTLARYTGRAKRYIGHVAQTIPTGTSSVVKVRWLTNDCTDGMDDANLPMMTAAHFEVLPAHEAVGYLPLTRFRRARPEDDFADTPRRKFLEGEWAIGVEVSPGLVSKAAAEILARGFGASDKTIERINKEKQMEHKACNLVALVQDDYTTAQVAFTTGTVSSKQYTYKVPTAWDVQAGDRLVVLAPDGLAIVLVKNVDRVPKIDVDAGFTYKWAVQKVNMHEFTERNAKEQAFAERLAEVERIRQRDEVLENARKAYGPNTKARREFDKAVKDLKG
jgi:hypothetical protein